MAARLIAGVAGTALLCGAIGAGGHVAAWNLQEAHAAHALTDRAAALAGPHKAEGPCVPPAATDGDLIGLLEVPALHLRAPVVEGEGDGVLADAVGHDTSSVPPGDDGTAVLAAHDVTYFGSLPALRAPDRIEYFDGCAEHVFDVEAAKVVPAGTPVADALTPTLVLDTCWPVDALWWTPDRYLVTAREVAVYPDRSAPTSSAPESKVPLAVPVPAALAAQGLGIDDNTVALGTLTVAGTPSTQLVDSPVPLDVEAAAMTAYFGGLHALAQERLDWWRALAPGVPAPPAEEGTTISTYDTRLDVTVVAAGDHATGAVLQAWVVLSDGVAGELTVRAAVEGHELVVSSWTMHE